MRLISKLFGRTHRKFTSSRPASLSRPEFEVLEPRLLLSTIYVDAAIADTYEQPAASDSLAEQKTAIGGSVSSFVSPPDRPKGPSTGKVWQELTYRTEGTDPLGAHDYKFKWGDGTTSGWSSKTKQSHVYKKPGTYKIRAKERCPLGLFETDWSDPKTVVITAWNSSSGPTVDNPIPDQDATQDVAFSFTFASDTFSGEDPDDTLTYSARRGSGAKLPGWLTFHPATRTFSGTPANADVGDLTVKVTATDQDGASATDQFVITVANVNDAPTLTEVDTLKGAIVGHDFTITYWTFKRASDAKDIDGDTLRFRIEAVTSGTLTKDGEAVTPGTTLLGPGESLVWRHADGEDGILDAFTVTAWDGELGSETPVQVAVHVQAPEVTVNRVKGDLVINGNDLGATIEVTQGSTPDEFVVTGLNNTKVNGATAATIAGVTDDVKIYMGRGDDQVTLDGAAVPDYLKVYTRAGDDTVTLSGVTVGGKTKIATIWGSDTVNIEDSVFGGKFYMGTGYGADTVAISSSEFAAAAIWTGWGSEDVDIDGTGFSGRLTLGTGGGEDTVNLSGSDVASLYLKTGPGQDDVSVVDLEAIWKVNVHLGWQSDHLYAQGIVGTTVVLNGAAGADTFEDGGGNPDAMKVVNFETLV